MATSKGEQRKPAHEPKKVKDVERDGGELKVEELEERIAPAKMY